MNYPTLRRLAVLLTLCVLADASAAVQGDEEGHFAAKLKFTNVAKGGTITLLMPEAHYIDTELTDGAALLAGSVRIPETIDIQTKAGDQPTDVAHRVKEKLETIPFFLGVYVKPDSTIVIDALRPGTIGLKSTDPAFQGPRPVENATYKHNEEGDTVLAWSLPKGEKYDKIWISSKFHYTTLVAPDQNEVKVTPRLFESKSQVKYRIIAERDGLPSDVVEVTARFKEKSEPKK